MFARTETDAFHRLVWGAASGLFFLRGRLTFCRPDGSVAPHNGGAPSVLVAYGPEDRDILAAAPIDGAFVPLRLETVVAGAWLSGTWAQELAAYIGDNPGPIELGKLYAAFTGHPKARKNQHWRAKLRQALQRGKFERVALGVWQKKGAPA